MCVIFRKLEFSKLIEKRKDNSIFWTKLQSLFDCCDKTLLSFEFMLQCTIILCWNEKKRDFRKLFKSKIKWIWCRTLKVWLEIYEPNVNLLYCSNVSFPTLIRTLPFIDKLSQPTTWLWFYLNFDICILINFRINCWINLYIEIDFVEKPPSLSYTT